MADDQNMGGGDRQMYQGNWACGQCKAPITELPFQPSEDRLDQLKCRDCFRQSRDTRGGGGGGGDRAPRQTYQGQWQCSKCGGSITELPFQPDPSRLDQLQCRDCHRQSRAF